MRKSTFIGNLVAWVAVAAACVAFLAWHHLTDFEVIAAAIGDSALGCAGVDRSKKGPSPSTCRATTKTAAPPSAPA